MPHLKHINLLFLIVVFPIFSVAHAEQEVSLDQYLVQVRQSNPGFKALLSAQKASLASQQASRLLFTPLFFFNASLAEDRSPTFSPQTEGNERGQTSLGLGLRQQTPFGQQIELEMGNEAYRIEGANPLYLPFDSFHEDKLSISLSQDLFRNFLGNELRAQHKKALALGRMGFHEATYSSLLLLSQAESVYWSLSLGREMVRFRKVTLDRSRELLSWVSSRVERKLADRSDLLQAKSDVQYRTIELATAEESVRKLSRSFNLLRGIDSEIVEEDLDSADDMFVKGLGEESDPLKSPFILAKEERTKSDSLSAFLQTQETLPQLKIYGAASLNGLNEDGTESFSQATGFSNRTWAIGVSFSVPLDFMASHQARKSAMEMDLSSRERLQQEKKVQLAEYKELRRNINDLFVRLRLVREMERTQQEKADYEYQRLKKGSTVTAQVLRFEQDLAQSRLGRTAVELELLGLMAKLRLYEIR